MSINVKNITKIYDSQKALDRVSFDVKQGEIVGLLGPNGAGKSTMMKIITCYKRQSSGKCSVCGFDVLENPTDVKRCIGYLPENNPLYLDMYVNESLEWIAKIYHTDNIKKRVADIIEKTGLGNEQYKKIYSLSKGYRQRLGLAHAIIHEPEVLILDEPTSGLDPNQLIEIRQLIRNISEKSTVLFSTHIMQEVEALCKRVIIINKGVIKADSEIEYLHKKYPNKSMEDIFHELTQD